MITIEINNVDEVVKEKAGKLAFNWGSKVVNFEKIAEKMAVRKIKNVFNEHGIEAEVKIK